MKGADMARKPNPINKLCTITLDLTLIGEALLAGGTLPRGIEALARKYRAKGAEQWRAFAGTLNSYKQHIERIMQERNPEAFEKWTMPATVNVDKLAVPADAFVSAENWLVKNDKNKSGTSQLAMPKAIKQHLALYSHAKRIRKQVLDKFGKCCESEPTITSTGKPKRRASERARITNEQLEQQREENARMRRELEELRSRLLSIVA